MRFDATGVRGTTSRTAEACRGVVGWLRRAGDPTFSPLGFGRMVSREDTLRMVSREEMLRMRLREDMGRSVWTELERWTWSAFDFFCETLMG